MDCIFCAIVAGQAPATIRYEDDKVLVIDNILHWVPVMFLAMPKTHMSQEELWQDMGEVARVAVEIGRQHCPNGFRLLSNFGQDALQTQEHGHLHILGGTRLGWYARPESP